MPELVEFQVPARLIVIEPAVETVDVLGDLYSAAKRQWLNDEVLNRFAFPFRIFGGDPLGGDLTAGAYVFLQNQNGWRIRPAEADGELTVVGNLYAEDAELPVFTPTLGGFTVPVFLERSSLTQSVTVDGSAPADSVWSLEEKDDVVSGVEFLRKIDSGRWRIVDDQLIFYDADGITPLQTFDLFGADGQPTSTAPFERVPAP